MMGKLDRKVGRKEQMLVCGSRLGRNEGRKG